MSVLQTAQLIGALETTKFGNNASVGHMPWDCLPIQQNFSSVFRNVKGFVFFQS